MIKNLSITLKSDMCAGSGYSYAGVIDSDTCFDENGLPFIPARRIKGCLRDAAELLGEDASFLGICGQGFQKNGEKYTRVTISDAVIEHYDGIARGIQETECLTKEIVLNQYTSIRSQTALDPKTGSADRHSLRFTRVVNHYDPISENELVFIAPIEIEGDEENEIAEKLKKLAKALHHMGLKRNRGLGNVRCRLEDGKIKNTDKNPDTDSDNKTGIDSDKKPDKIKNREYCDQESEVTLCYTVYNESPLMISKNSNQKTETYINGQTVLGFFASRYLKKHGFSADKDFEDRFLKNNLQFTPLYPSDSSGNIYYPAPSYICCLKKSKIPVNSAADIPADLQNPESYNAKSPAHGNQPKKLKGKYVREDLKGEFPKEVNIEVIFHNRHDEDPEERQLYVSHAISKGQYFTGMITGKSFMVKEMEAILSSGDLSFGKSRTAQYGKCSLAFGEYRKKDSSRQTFHAEDRILVVLRSDAIFQNELNYTVDLEEVRSEIQKSMNIQCAESEEMQNLPYSEIEVKELTGYYSVWNLKRQSLPAVCAGSTFEFILKEDCEIDTIFQTGEKKGEGFGICHVIKNDGKWELTLPKKTDADHPDTPKDQPENENETAQEAEVFKNSIAVLIQKAVMEEIRTEILKRANEVEKTALNASSVGRLTLMVEESMIETAEKATEETDDENSFKCNLDERIDSIKDKKKRENVQEFVDKYYDVPSVETGVALGYSLSAKEQKALKLFSLRQALIILKYKTKEAN